MPEVKIKRRYRALSVAITTASATSDTFRMDDMSGGVVSIGTISTNAATLQVWGNTTDSGTFVRLYDSSGAVADITLAGAANTAAGACYALPDAAYGLPFVKLVAGTTSANTTASVMLKS